MNLAFLALLCYYGGGRGKAPGRLFLACERLPLDGAAAHFLFLHDPLNTLSEFFERVALLNQLEDRLEQCLGDVHLVHSLTSFLKGFSPALRVYNTSFRVICQYIFYIFS